MWLDGEQFKGVVGTTPLISIDLIVRNTISQALLGRRNNRPAQGDWFVPGGRITKNETIADAYARLLYKELGVKGGSIDDAKFLGVYQHFYADSVFGDSPSTHYIVLGFEICLESVDICSVPLDQHDDYKWFDEAALLEMSEVHHYTKDYFRKSLSYR